MSTADILAVSLQCELCFPGVLNLLDLAGIPRVPWTQGHSLLPRLRGEASPQKFAVGGYHPHKGRVSCVSVWTEEWALMYSPTDGLEGSELYHVPTNPTHTRNVIAEHGGAAKDLLHLLETWFDGLGVSPERKRQLIHNARFTLREKLRYKLWLRQRKQFYQKNYGVYAGK